MIQILDSFDNFNELEELPISEKSRIQSRVSARLKKVKISAKLVKIILINSKNIKN